MIQPNVYVIHEYFDGGITKHHGGVERVDRLRAIGVITGIITMQLDPTKRDIGADIDKALQNFLGRVVVEIGPSRVEAWLSFGVDIPPGDSYSAPLSESDNMVLTTFKIELDISAWYGALCRLFG